MGLLVLQVLWTRDSEIALKTAKRDRGVMKRTNQWFLDLLNTLIDVTVEDLTKYMRAKYEALITIHVHQRFDINENTSNNNNIEGHKFLTIVLGTYLMSYAALESVIYWISNG